MTDLWVNQCIACGTSNVSLARQRPKICAGCNQALECLGGPEWMQSKGPQDVVFTATKKPAVAVASTATVDTTKKPMVEPTKKPKAKRKNRSRPKAKRSDKKIVKKKSSTIRKKSK